MRASARPCVRPVPADLRARYSGRTRQVPDRAELPGVPMTAAAPSLEDFNGRRHRLSAILKIFTLLSAADVIRLLDLKPHPEGGHFRESFRAGRAHRRPGRIDGDLFPPRRAASARIGIGWKRRSLALLRRPATRAEIATCRARHPRSATTSREAKGRRTWSPRRAWLAAVSLGGWTLVGCTVAPGFQFRGFELAPQGLVSRRRLNGSLARGFASISLAAIRPPPAIRAAASASDERACA